MVRRMKILLTLPGPLFPADSGGKIRSLNIFSRLAKTAEIHAVSFADPDIDAGAIPDMKAMFASYTPVYRKEARKYSCGFYAQVLANQLSSWPYFLAKCNHARLGSTATEIAGSGRFDLLFCDFLNTAAPLREFAFRPKVVFENNVELLLRKRKWQTGKRSMHKLVYHREWRKTHAIEAQVCRSFDHVITVSDDDRRALQEDFDIRHVSTLPTGVDTGFFRPVDVIPQAGRMVFVGSMDWDPNEDGVLWFLQEVYPRIRREMPDASLTIVGRNPSPRLRAIASAHAGVEVTGRVPDVRPYLAEAEVVVVPLRVGGGTRIKIPEAMAMAKPVVATPVGAEGLPFRDGRELCIAERPADFAQVVLELLRDPLLRISIGAAGRREVVEKHSWESVADTVEEILEHVAWNAKHERAAWKGTPCAAVNV